jgi:hypothetical protein
MKRVFSSQKETAQVFAKQSQNSGQSSTGTLYFNNNAIYSYGYHFPIAYIIGDNLAIFNHRGYSNTTAKHKSNVLSALIEAGYTVLTFPIYSKGYGHDQVDIEKWYLDEIAVNIKRLERARTTWTKENATENIEKLKREVNIYKANKVIVDRELS